MASTFATYLTSLAAFLELHLGVMLDTVRVGEHAVAGDDEPGSSWMPPGVSSATRL